jgi:hypothetical protein
VNDFTPVRVDRAAIVAEARTAAQQLAARVQLR